MIKIQKIGYLETRRKIDTSAPMSAEDKKKLQQQVCRTFLYYARAVDYTMLYLLDVLATRVKDGIQETVKTLQNFLDYCATHPESIVLS